MERLVTVIVPSYNASATLPRLVASLREQTYGRWEALMVDDGSTDDTAQVLQRLAADEPRMRVISIPNGGVSRARNVGLEAAQGEYVMFCDSDDYVHPDWIATLVAAKTEEVDLAVCNVTAVSGVSQTRRNSAFTGDVDAAEALRHLIVKSRYTAGLPQVWNKVYDMRLIREHGLRFNERQRFAEDWFFNLLYIYRCRKIRFIAESLYYYNIGGAGSLTHAFRRDCVEESILWRKEVNEALPGLVSDREFLERVVGIEQHYQGEYVRRFGYKGFAAWVKEKCWGNADVRRAHRTLENTSNIKRFAQKHSYIYICFVNQLRNWLIHLRYNLPIR